MKKTQFKIGEFPITGLNKTTKKNNLRIGNFPTNSIQSKKKTNNKQIGFQLGEFNTNFKSLEKNSNPFKQKNNQTNSYRIGEFQAAKQNQSNNPIGNFASIGLSNSGMGNSILTRDIKWNPQRQQQTQQVQEEIPESIDETTYSNQEEKIKDLRAEQSNRNAIKSYKGSNAPRQIGRGRPRKYPSGYKPKYFYPKSKKPKFKYLSTNPITGKQMTTSKPASGTIYIDRRKTLTPIRVISEEGKFAPKVATHYGDVIAKPFISGIPTTQSGTKIPSETKIIKTNEGVFKVERGKPIIGQNGILKEGKPILTKISGSGLFKEKIEQTIDKGTNQFSKGVVKVTNPSWLNQKLFPKKTNEKFYETGKEEQKTKKQKFQEFINSKRKEAETKQNNTDETDNEEEYYEEE